MSQHVDFLYLNMAEVQSLLPGYSEAVNIVEKVFIAQDENKAILPPKFALDLEHIYGGHLNIMPGYLADLNIQGIKLITAYLGNKEKGLPSAMAMINLYDTETGRPLAIMDGSLITLLRTGAATGVAAKYLARHGSQTLGIFGAGAVSGYHIQCVLETMPTIREIKIYDINEEAAEALAQKITQERGIKAYQTKSHEETAAEADIIVTCTRMAKPTPLVKKAWVKPGCFIAATGQCYELDYELPKVSKIIVDNVNQCKHVHSGWGFSVLFDDAVITWDDIHGDIGEVINHKKAGREREDEIIVMWARGMGTQDVATGYHIYLKALEKGIGQNLNYL